MGEGVVNKKLSFVTLLVMTLVLSFVAIPITLTQPTDSIQHLKKDTTAEPLDLDPAWSYDTASAEPTNAEVNADYSKVQKLQESEKQPKKKTRV